MTIHLAELRVHACNLVETVKLAEVLHLHVAGDGFAVPHAVNCRNIFCGKIENAAQFGVGAVIAYKIMNHAERVIVQLFKDFFVLWRLLLVWRFSM